MNATAMFHEAVTNACGFGVRDEADRVVRFIESTRDSMIAHGTDARVAFASAYQTAQLHSACGEYAWKLVNQHFGTTGQVLVRASHDDIVAHFGRVFGYAA